MEEKLKILYDTASKHYDLGSYDDFKVKMASPEKQKAFYDVASKKFDLGKYEDFSAKISQKKNPAGSVSSDSSSPQESAPVVDTNTKIIGGGENPVLEANWETGKINEYQPTGQEISESPYKLTVTDKTSDSNVTTGYKNTPEENAQMSQAATERIKAMEPKLALNEVRVNRKGDYESDAVERMERGLTDMEKLSMNRRTPIERLMFDTDVTSREYKAQSLALSNDQENLSKGLDGIDEEIRGELGDAAFEQYRQDISDYELLYKDYELAKKNNQAFSQEKADDLNNLKQSIEKFQQHPLIAERDGMIRAMNKNLSRFKDIQEGDGYKGVRDMIETRKAIAGQVDDQDFFSDASGIIINSLAKMVSGAGRFVKSTVQSFDEGANTPISDFLIDIQDDADLFFPSPSKYTRPLRTSTAKWNGYEVDFSKDKIQSVRKDGKVVDMALTPEQEAEIKSLEKKNQWNLEGAPYQTAQVVTDMAVMLAGADKVSKGLTAFGVSKQAAAKSGVMLSIAGQTSNQLYEQGLEVFDGDKQKASQYAVLGGLSIGAVGTLFGLETRLLNGTKGFMGSTAKTNIPAAVGQMTLKQKAATGALAMLRQGVGEGLEESVLENAALAINQSLLGGTPEMPDTNEMISNGVMGFAIGSLFGAGTVSQEINDVQKSSLLAASKDPVAFEQNLRKAIERGDVEGDEEFISRQVSRATRIGAEMDKLSPDIKDEKMLDAVGLIDKKLVAQQRLDEVKGNEEPEARYQAELDVINKELSGNFKQPEPEVAQKISENAEEDQVASTPSRSMTANKVVTTPSKPSKVTYETKEGDIDIEVSDSDIDLSVVQDIEADAFMDVIDKDGNTGKLTIFSGGRMDLEQDGTIREIGNVRDGEKLSDLGLQILQPASRKFTVNGQQMYNLNSDPEQAINYNEDGDVESVDLTSFKRVRTTQGDVDVSKSEGSTITGPGARVIAEQILFNSKIANNEESIAEFEQFIQDEFGGIEKLREAANRGAVEVDTKIPGQQETVEKTAPVDPRDSLPLTGNQITGIAKTGGIIEDGLIALGLKFPEKTTDWLKKFYKKTFTSKGLLNSEVFERDRKRKAHINASMKRASYKGRDLKSQLKKEFPKGAPENVLKDIDRILKGENPSGPVSLEVQAIAKEMRAHVDNLSRDFIFSGVASRKMVATIQENMETYLTRSYRVHDDPNWIKKVKDLSVWTRAKAFMESEIQKKMADLDAKIAKSKSQDRIDSLNKQKQSYQKKLADMDAYLEAMLNDQSEKSGPANQGQGGAKLGAKNLGIFKQRKDLPKEIRELFGEYEDPIMNYTKSIFKMAHLLENAKFLSDVRKSGEGVFLFSEPKDGFTSKIAADESSTMNPLNGMYTSAELKEAFERFGKPDEMPNWLMPLVWMASKAKYAKTILSPTTHVRNFMFNMAFHWANGHFGIDPSAWKEAWSSVKSDLIGGKSEESFAKYIELGIVGDSSTMGEMMALLEETKNGYDQMFGETDLAKKIVQPALVVAEKSYQAEDDFHKVVAFHVERGRYAKSWYEKSFDELSWQEKIVVEERAAKIVRDTLPTYSMVSENMKRLRRIPLTGTFVSFPYEVLRVTANTMKLAREEFLDPRTRVIGAKRGVGLVSVMVGFVALSKIMHGMAGLFGDDEDKVRDFLPPWSSDSLILPLEKSGADFTYIDVTSILPQGYILESLNTLFDERKGADERFRQFLYRLAEPYVGWDMTAKRLKELVDNKTETGRTIVSQDLPFSERAADSFGYISEIFEPGFSTTGRRIYRSFTQDEFREYGKLNPKYELMALFPGVRVSTTNFETSFKYRAREISERKQDAVSIYRGPLRRGADKEKLDALREKGYGAYKNMFAEISRIYLNAVELGADPKVLQDYLDGFNKEEKRHIRAGTVPPISIMEPKK